MTQPCKFCNIVTGDTPARIVYADRSCLAFLDHRPLFPGHILLVPHDHHATLPELPPELITPLFGAARLLAKAVEVAMEADGVFVAMNNTVSQSVSHFHVHIVPRKRGDGLKGFFWPRHTYTDEAEADRVGEAIRAVATRLVAEGWNNQGDVAGDNAGDVIPAM